jgi:DNA repair exonuclease SbcCD ATPase subunit
MALENRLERSESARITLQERVERSERARAALEEKLGKTDSDLKNQLAKTDADLKARQERAEADLRARLEKAAQERKEDVQGFLQSQANLGTKLDELTTEARLAQGRSEEIGHSISESSRRIDDMAAQVEQFGRRVASFEKQVSQAAVAAREATATALAGLGMRSQSPGVGR